MRFDPGCFSAFFSLVRFDLLINEPRVYKPCFLLSWHPFPASPRRSPVQLVSEISYSKPVLSLVGVFSTVLLGAVSSQVLYNFSFKNNSSSTSPFNGQYFAFLFHCDCIYVFLTCLFALLMPFLPLFLGPFLVFAVLDQCLRCIFQLFFLEQIAFQCC